MTGRKITTEFFNRSTIRVARELLGKYIVRKIGGKVMTGRIIETEVYRGPKDLASHASKGRTKRTETMFGPPGFAYVYLVYGMYHCFNIVTEKEGYPAAVLIRGLNLLGCDGPGKLCREFKIDRKFNGKDITDSQEIWLEDRGEKISNNKITATPRIGVDYAGEYKNKLWRFVLIPSE